MRTFLRAAAAVSIVIGSLLATVPASAEYTSQPYTRWGTATKGNSATIGEWNATAWAVDQVGNTMFVGGNFLDVTDGTNLYRQSYLAAFDADTGAWQSWFDPQVDSAVFALQPSPDGGLFVGGEMNVWNGETRGALVKIDPTTGEVWPGWRTHLYGGNAVVRDLKLEADGRLYATGTFPYGTNGDGQIALGGAVRIDPATGVIDSSWRPILGNGAGWGIDRSPTTGTVYIAGFFLDVNGIVDGSTKGFVGVDDSGAVVVDRSPVPYNGCTGNWPYCPQMYDVEVTDQGDIWVGGVEHALYVIDEATLALKKMHYTACDPNWNDQCDPAVWHGGEFQEIEQIGNRVYATCHCWYDLYSDTTVIKHTRPYDNPTAVHSTINAIAAFDATTADHITSFMPLLGGDSGGFGIHRNPSDGCLWVVGGISSYGPPGGVQPGADDVVRLCDEAGPGPAAPTATTPPGPSACTASDDGNLQATVAWTSEPSAAGTIIYRSVNGGSTYWRGRVNPPAASTFGEALEPNSVTEYSVEHVYVGGQRSPRIPCGLIDLSPELRAPAWCNAEIGADNRPELTWEAGNDAESYIVRRSVDGGTFYWRGRVTGTTFTGSQLGLGSTYDYTVSARAADGSQTAQVPCTPQLTLEVPELAAVEACEAGFGGPGNDIPTLGWDSAPGATRYIVRRAVDGGTAYWRASVDEASAIDGRLGYVGPQVTDTRSYAYSVTAVGADGSRTEPTPCAPPLSLTPPGVPAVGACVATDPTDDGNGTVSVTVTWHGPLDPAYEVIVYRSRNGGSSYWRGRLGSDAARFTDSARLGDTYLYELVVSDAAGTRSDRTTCS